MSDEAILKVIKKYSWSKRYTGGEICDDLREKLDELLVRLVNDLDRLEKEAKEQKENRYIVLELLGEVNYPAPDIYIRLYDEFEKQQKKLIEKYSGNIKELYGKRGPSSLFKFLLKKLGYILEYDPKKCYTKIGGKIRKKVHTLIRKIGPKMFTNPQVIINDRSALFNEGEEQAEYLHTGIVDPNTCKEKIIKRDISPKANIPSETAIYASNHFFKDDVLSSYCALENNAYLMIGSIPQMFNTIDGLLVWAEGCVVINREDPYSRKSSTEKGKYLSSLNIDLLIYPEGVWNKTPNLLMLPLWHGIYKMAKEKNQPVVPIIHYIKNPLDSSKENNIFTVVGDPLYPNDFASRDDFIAALRSSISMWKYRLMEKYGRINGENQRKRLLEETAQIIINYRKNRLIKDKAFRKDFDCRINLSTLSDDEILQKVRISHNNDCVNKMLQQLKDVEYRHKLVTFWAKKCLVTVPNNMESIATIKCRLSALGIQVNGTVVKHTRDDIARMLKTIMSNPQIMIRLFANVTFANEFAQRALEIRKILCTPIALQMMPINEIINLLEKLQQFDLDFDCSQEYSEALEFKQNVYNKGISYEEYVEMYSKKFDTSSPTAIWDEYLKEMSTVPQGYYSKIETSAHYQDPAIKTIEDVFQPFADALVPSNNIGFAHQIEAKKLVLESKNSNFQKKY